MLLIELNSISNMGCQKIKVARSLRYSGYLTHIDMYLRDLCNNKQKSFVPKKNRHVSIRDFKKQKKSDFLYSNTC